MNYETHLIRIKDEHKNDSYAKKVWCGIITDLRFARYSPTNVSCEECHLLYFQYLAEGKIHKQP
jgi:hypothetical protein